MSSSDKTPILSAALSYVSENAQHTVAVSDRRSDSELLNMFKKIKYLEQA